MDSVPVNTRHPLPLDTTVLCATIMVAPELMGGAFPWSVAAIAGLCLVSLTTALWVRRGTAGNPCYRWPAPRYGCRMALDMSSGHPPFPSVIAHTLGTRDPLTAGMRLRDLFMGRYRIPHHFK